jgi:hypothetical protein
MPAAKCFRLVADGKATWQDVTERMTILDVENLCDFLDAWDEAGRASVPATPQLPPWLRR